mmetsp:Transcript_5268/g.17059  ORF Transcript_5268/g.17059 Transcript_5268/m.17059 type:complete len:322 (+) Transcript_5268:1116-2081(+)
MRKSRTLIMPQEAARCAGVRISWFRAEQLAPFSTRMRMLSTSPLAANWHISAVETSTLRAPPRLRINFCTSTCRCRTASSRGVRSFRSLAFTSASLSKRNSTMSFSPSEAAICKAVLKLVSGVLGCTPLTMSRFSSSILPIRAAWQRSWPPSCTSKTILPPLSRSSFATASCLCRTASLRLVWRKASSAFTSAPLFSRNLTTSTWPSEEATCSGVRLRGSDTLTLSLLRACLSVTMSPRAAALRMSLVRCAFRCARRISTLCVKASLPLSEPSSFSSSESDFAIESWSFDTPSDLSSALLASSPFSLLLFCEPEDRDRLPE